MKQYIIEIACKTTPAKNTINITCSNEAKALEVASQQYGVNWNITGVTGERPAHYFYNEIDATKE